MAFPAANVWIEAGPFRFFAKSRHPDTPLESRPNWAGHFRAQAHKFAGVGPVYGWDRAGGAQGSPPGSTEQAAFFAVAAAVIVAIKILALRSSRRFHNYR